MCLASIVIVMCGVMITMEIYQRIFKIYILIPFSTLSYSTFVMGNRSGGEVFSGYLKSIIQVALEAMVIMLAISFTYRLCNNSAVMQKLFPAKFNDYAVVAATSYDDYIVLNEFVSNYSISYDEDAGSMDSVIICGSTMIMQRDLPKRKVKDIILILLGKC